MQVKFDAAYPPHQGEAFRRYDLHSMPTTEYSRFARKCLNRYFLFAKCYQGVGYLAVDAGSDCCSSINVVIDRTVELKQLFDKHETNNREDFAGVWSAINDIRNRLPNWAVALISALMGIVGYLAKG